MSRVYYPQARAILQVILDGFGEPGSDTPPKIINILPKEVSIHRNTYRQADGWELTFDALDFPIDPQLVRAGSCEIFLEQVPGIGAADQRINARQLSTQQKRDAALGPQGSANTVALEANLPKAKDNAVFSSQPSIVGLFDDHSLNFSGSGRWVTLSGQDYTAFLAARQWPPRSNGRARRIPTGQRLDRLLTRLLREADPKGVMQLRVDASVNPNDLPNVGAKESRCHKRGIPVEQDTSYWDVMYGLAVRYGLILFVNGIEVVLARPQNLSSQFDPKIKRLAWGMNIETMDMSRRLGKEKVPRIRVVGYDTSGRRTTTVEVPSSSQEVPQGTLGVNQDEFQIVPVYGIEDRSVLRQAAENLFHLLGQSERTVRITTKDLKDLGEDGRGAQDMLTLKAGDAVKVEFLEFNISQAFLQDDSIPSGTKSQHLVARGYNPEIADLIATHYERLKFLQRPLRVREVSYEYSVDDGITIELELVDFIVVDGKRKAANKEARKDQRTKKYRGSNVARK